MWLLIPTCWCPTNCSFGNTLILVVQNFTCSTYSQADLDPKFILVLIRAQKLWVQLEVENCALSFCDSAFLC